MLLSLSLSLLSAAHAEADLATSFKMESSPLVYAEQRVRVKVRNNGADKANDVELVVQLPETNTSPSVYVMGDLGVYSSRCVESGTTLVCDMGNIKAGKQKRVDIYISLPQSAAELMFEAEATTTTTESNTSDNIADAVADLTYYDLVVSGPQDITNRHCTGTDLTAFYECTLFPSSISSHTATLESNGDVSFASQPGYAGSWWQNSDDSLEFEYTYNGTVVLEFYGEGVDGTDCFEGLSDFGTGYVAPYEVCLD